MILGRNRDVVRPWTRVARVYRQVQLKASLLARIEFNLDGHGGGGALHHGNWDVVGVLGLPPDSRC